VALVSGSLAGGEEVDVDGPVGTTYGNNTGMTVTEGAGGATGTAGWLLEDGGGGDGLLSETTELTPVLGVVPAMLVAGTT